MSDELLRPLRGTMPFDVVSLATSISLQARAADLKDGTERPSRRMSHGRTNDEAHRDDGPAAVASVLPPGEERPDEVEGRILRID